MTTSQRVEALVVGAGVVGLAVARALALSGREVLILESAAGIGSATSSRNSEVIHGGLYYPKDSNKAKFCVKGREMIYNYCHSSDFQKCGKLIVAATSQQYQTKLLPIYHQARQNGVSDVELLQPDQVQEMEPSVLAPGGALWSPSTGIVNSHNFMYQLLADAENHGATLALNTSLQDALIQPGRPIEVLSKSSGNVGDDDDMWIACDILVNCAGLWADEVARLFRSPDDSSLEPPQQHYCKGNYFKLVGRPAPFSRLIYPLPDERGGLGVHATIDLSNQVKFGPDVEWQQRGTRPDDLDYTVDQARAALFYDSIRQYWPELPDDSLVADYAGFRPKLAHPSSQSVKTQDFTLLGPNQHGVNGLLHLLGIESPGLTSSMALAEHIVFQKLWDGQQGTQMSLARQRGETADFR